MAAKDDVGDSFLPPREVENQRHGNTSAVTSVNELVSIRILGRKCTIIKPLLLLKTMLFLFYGAAASTHPFVIVLLEQKGITASDIALVFTLSPILQAVVQATTGIVFDKTGQYKMVFFVLCVLNMAFTNFLLLLPHNSKSLKSNCTIDDLKDFIVNCTFHDSIGVNCYLKNTELESHCLNFTANNSSCDHFNCSVQLDETPQMETDDIPTTFLVIAASLVLIGQTAFSSSIYRCMDVVVLEMVKNHSSDFGTQRFWCLLGGAIIPAFGGYVVQLTSPPNGDKNCSTAIFLFDACVIMILVCLWKLNLKSQPPAKNMSKQAKVFLKDADVLMFLLTVLVSGISWCFYYYFTPYYLAQLKASALNLGLRSATSFVVGLPVVLSSKWCIQKIGVKLVFFLALVSHALQCTSFSYIVNPWWSIPCECFYIFNYHLMWVAVVTHAHRIAPKDITATLVVMAGVMHYTIGKGLGSLIGGFIMGKFGGPWAFRTMATLCGVTAVIYSSFLVFRRKRNRNQRQVYEFCGMRNNQPI